MPLLKLWNSLRRRSKEQSTAEQIAAPVSGEVIAKPAKTAPKRRLFRGGPNNALCRQLKGLGVSSVVEVSVGDGSRALDVMRTLRKQSQHAIRYAAIDLFELGGSPMALKDFFRLLREQDIRPQLFPETLDNGLRSVANTIGSIDLVLIAAPVDQWQNPVTLHLLSRISHPQTAVFFEDGEVWARYEPHSHELRRAG